MTGCLPGFAGLLAALFGVVFLLVREARKSQSRKEKIDAMQDILDDVHVAEAVRRDGDRASDDELDRVLRGPPKS